MLAVEVVKEVRDRGVELAAVDDRLRFRPAGSLPPELKFELKEHKTEILEILADGHPLEPPCQRCSARSPRYAKLRNTGEVLQMARGILRVPEDPVTPPMPPGRDPMAQRSGDKVRFFKGDWREAEPRGFGVYRPDGAA